MSNYDLTGLPTISDVTIEEVDGIININDYAVICAYEQRMFKPCNQLDYMETLPLIQAWLAREVEAGRLDRADYTYYARPNEDFFMFEAWGQARKCNARILIAENMS